MTTETLTAPATTTKRVTPLKPSEALRLGRLTRPEESVGLTYDGRYGACALGAMAVGYGHTPDPAAEVQITAVYEFLVPYLPDQTKNRIVDLNDGAGWNTEQIATWLEGFGL